STATRSLHRRSQTGRSSSARRSFCTASASENGHDARTNVSSSTQEQNRRSRFDWAPTATRGDRSADPVEQLAAGLCRLASGKVRREFQDDALIGELMKPLRG